MTGRLFNRIVAAVLALGLFASAPAAVVAQPPAARLAVLGRAPAPAVSPVPGYVAAIVGGFSSAPNAGRQTCITAFVQTLYDAGTWARTDALYVLAAGEDQGSRVNWKNPGVFNAGKTGTGGTFNTDLGWNAFSSGNILDTGFNPSTAGGLFIRNNAHFFAAVQTDSNDAVSAHVAGISGYAGVQPRSSTGAYVTYSQSTGQDTGSANTGKGLYGWNRTASGAYDRYKNGSLVDSPTRSSLALPSVNLTIGTHNAAQYTTKTVSLVSIGGGLSGAQVTALWNGYSAYMTCIGGSAT